MRFRVAPPAGSSVQIGIALVWIVLTAVRLGRDVHAGAQGGAAAQACLLVFWGFALAMQVLHGRSGIVEVEQAAIHVRKGRRAEIIPYTSIVSADFSSDDSKRKQHVVELEIARLDRGIYPHEYRELRLREAEAFLVAVRQRLASGG